MPRSWIRRAGALSLALWMSVSLAERAVSDHCPLHDPLAAAAPMSHHGAAHGPGDAHAPQGKSHRCGCLEQCCGTPAIVLPSSAVRLTATVRAVASPTPRTPGAIAPARIDMRLPFANGPPHALVA